MSRAACAALVLGLAVVAALAQTAPSLTVLAAGSLRAALTEVARAHERAAGVVVQLQFGPSGTLKDRIVAGEPAQVFASANMSHPQALRDAGRAERVLPFARNRLCLLGAAGFGLGGRALADVLLDPVVRVATSTPRADPAGDYAFEMFDRIESTGAASSGAAARLKAKALQLTGGPGAAPAPAGRSAYGALMEARAADVFVTYCTNAAQAQHEVPALQVLPVPDALNVAAAYGIATVRPAGPAAEAFVDFVLGPEGQRILARHGFSPP